MIHKFDNWNSIKKKLSTIKKTPLFKEKEIWWCSLGINIGSEIYGKGHNFTRPILILKKFNKYSFLGIPLTTKVKNKFGYYKFNFKEKEICAVIAEIKKIDSRRLQGKMGQISDNKFENIKEKTEEMIFSPL